MSTRRLYEGSASSHRLTPDIIVDPPYSMTKRQYDAHLRMLEDIDRQQHDSKSWGIVHRNWVGRLYSDRNPLPRDEELAWRAIFRAGLAREVDYRPGYVLTKYGQLYLDQRKGSASRDRAQRANRTRRRMTSRDPSKRATEYRGFRIMPFEGVSSRASTHASLRRGEMTGGSRKERGYLIHLPDGGTKFVPTQKRAREYIDNYLGGT